MPKVSDEYKLIKRQQIIDAAYRCFARNGFHQSSMRDIYEEAQLSAGAVYHYFESKEQIIQASFKFDQERSQVFFDTFKASDEPVLALTGIVDFFFKGLEGAAQLGANRVNIQGWGEALRNPELLQTIQEAFGGYKAVLAEIVVKGQKTGEINRALNPFSVGETLISLYLGLELQKAWNPDLNFGSYQAVVTAFLQGHFTKSKANRGSD